MDATMKDALLVHLDDDLAAAWWLVTDHLGNGIGLPRRGTLAEAAAQRGDRRSVLLVPAEHCMQVEVRSPARDRAKLLRALPALVEERLAGDVDDQHLTAGPLDADGACRVLVVERRRMDAWLAAARTAGLDPDLVLPDAACLPAGPIVACDGRRALLRSGAKALALAPAALPLVPALLAAGGELRLLATADGAADAAAVAAACAAAGLRVDEEPVAAVELERILLRGVDDARGADLRHGPYRGARALRARAARWRLPSLLAASWIGIAALSQALEVGMLLRERRQAAADLAPLLAQVAPEAVAQPDPRPYLEARLARRAGAGRDGGLLADLERSVAALRGVGGAQLVGVDARAGEVELAVRAGDLTGLEAARAAVESSLGRAVELRGATSGDGRAEARLAVAP